MADDKKGFVPQRLRLFRELRGLSVREVAERLPEAGGRAVIPLTVRNWECGRTEPRATDLFALAAVLKIDLMELYGVAV